MESVGNKESAELNLSNRWNLWVDIIYGKFTCHLRRLYVAPQAGNRKAYGRSRFKVLRTCKALCACKALRASKALCACKVAELNLPVKDNYCKKPSD